MLEAAQIGMQERGKAQVGDKTVLDAMAPTVAAPQDRGRKWHPAAGGIEKSLAPRPTRVVKATIR